MQFPIGINNHPSSHSLYFSLPLSLYKYILYFCPIVIQFTYSCTIIAAFSPSVYFPPLSVFAGVLLLRKILAHRQATPPKYHSEPKTTPGWRPFGKPNQTYRAWTVSWISVSWLSKLDWATPGLCKMKLWAKRVKFHSINEPGHHNISPA